MPPTGWSLKLCSTVPSKPVAVGAKYETLFVVESDKISSLGGAAIKRVLGPVLEEELVALGIQVSRHSSY